MKIGKPKHRRIRFLLPNMLTLMNALAGFAALIIFFYMLGRGRQVEGTVLAGWFILTAVLFDGLDGFAARKLDAASSAGLQLDSLADFLTFGSAPPVIIAFTCIMSGRPALAVYGSITAGLYLCCSAWRLAVYNVTALEGKTDGIFRGLPVPGAAAAVMSSLVLVAGDNSGSWLLWFTASYTLAAGLLMVSRVSYVHMWKWVTSERRGVRYLLTAVVFFSLVFFLGPIGAVTVFSVVYIFSGPAAPFVGHLTAWRTPKAERQRTADGG